MRRRFPSPCAATTRSLTRAALPTARLLIVATSLLAGVSFAEAQQLPPVTPQLQPDVRLPQVPSADQPRPLPEIEVAPGAATRMPAGADNIRIRLQRVRIDGMTAYPADAFAPLYAPLIGEEVPLSRLYELRSSLERRYREDGNILTRVIIPAQTVRDGEFRLQVIEGYIDGLKLEGDIGPAAALVERYLRAVIGQQPLRLPTLERYLLLANDIPGVSVQGLLRPSPSRVGAAELIARMDRKPFDALLLVDNYGTRFTGFWESATSVAANAFTSLGESNSITGLVSDPVNGFDNNNEWVVQYRTSWLLGGDGAFVEGLVSYGNSQPGYTVEEFGFDSTTLLLSVNAGYPIIRSRNFNLTALAGFNYENATVNADGNLVGSSTYSRDRLRYFNVTLRGDARDAWRGSTRAEIELQQGADILNATTKDGQTRKSRPDGTAVSTLLQASLSRLQSLVRNFELFAMQSSLSLYTSASGQYAYNDLLSSQLFELGGLQYGRGYDLGEFSGDHGIGLSTELQLSQRPPVDFIGSYQLFLFVDRGWVWFRNGGEGDDRLTSFGGGVRLSLFDHLSLEMLGAQPVSPDSERSNGGKDPQFLVRAMTTW